MVNFKVRFKNPVFIAQFILAILTPVLAYAGLTAADLTTWKTLGDLILGAISNPYVLSLVAVSVWNCINDPTTPGLVDSDRSLTYTVPGINEDEFDDEIFDDSEDYDEDEIDDFDEDEMAKADEIEEE